METPSEDHVDIILIGFGIFIGGKKYGLLSQVLRRRAVALPLELTSVKGRYLFPKFAQHGSCAS